MIIHDVEQGSPEWLALRCGVPTASDHSCIFTASKADLSASVDPYIAELIDEIARPMSERSADEQAAVFSGNRHTERGHDLEPKARNWFRKVKGMDARQVGFVTNDDGTLGCSPDSLIFLGDIPESGLEIKAPEGKKHALWMLRGTLPDEHKQQVHGSMVVTGLRSWWFMSHCPGYAPFAVKVEWDEYTDKAAKALATFVERYAAAKQRFSTYLEAA